MEVLSFRWRAKYGHFLRAEANVNALTYPMPPRTAVLGLLGALLGLEKDALVSELQGARVSVGGPAPRRFWHKVKLRKDTPGPLPLTVKRGQKGTEAEKNRAALIHQEWLWEPDFLVHIALPDQPERFEELVERVRERGWHFSPCMGLSELLAEVEFVSCEQGRPLPAGLVEVHGTCLSAEAQLRAGQGVGLHMLRMPHHVSEDRVFTHAAYYVERQGQPFTVETARAWRVGDWTLMFS